jgi:glutamate racemase
MKVGFFDSGSGAHHVEQSFLISNPGIETLVYADYKNCPYGDREHEEIVDLTTQWVNHLFQEWCDVVILACNTASVHALRHLQNTLPRHQRILGVTYPACEAIRDGNFQNVVVFSTDATRKSWVYTTYIHLIAGNHISVTNISIPWLVQAIEENNILKQKDLIQASFSHIPDDTQIDAIILGCTHYPIIADIFQEVQNTFKYLKNATLIDPGLEAGKRFISWQKHHYHKDC